jgi:hypothetical protein
MAAESSDAVCEAEKLRLELLRRALLNVVAQVRDLDPNGRYTLSIAIVPRDHRPDLSSHDRATSAGLAASRRPA